MKTRADIIKSVILGAAAVALFMLPGLELPYLDKNTDSYFEDSITKASLAYGVCRVVNASVSIIKESQIQIEPAGLGVSLAAGQVLDPLDDMTERASDILVTAIVSLGIQKIAYEISVAFAPPLIGIAVFVFIGISYAWGSRASLIRKIVLKTIILLAVARLFLPASSIINSYLNEEYFTPKITDAKDALVMSSPELERLKDMTMPEIDGALGTVKNGFEFVEKKTSDLGAALKSILINMKGMISNLLTLSYLYVAIFVIQVIILPLGVFWLLARIINVLFGYGMPNILSHSDIVNKLKEKTMHQKEPA